MKPNTINNNTIISFWIIDCSYFYTPTTIEPSVRPRTNYPRFIRNKSKKINKNHFKNIVILEKTCFTIRYEQRMISSNICNMITIITS